MERLSASEIRALMASWPAPLRPLALELRARVLDVAPEVAEKEAFHALCYYKPHAPYGAIGGNVCLVALKDGRLEIAFLHGASLPDPERLMQGTGKAKRRVPIATSRDVARSALAALIRAAVAYDPSAARSRPEEAPPSAEST